MLSEFSKDILTMLVAAAPVSELRGALPLAIFAWDIAPLKAYFLSILGNFLPVIPFFLFLRFFLYKLSSKFNFVKKTSEWILERTREKHKDKFKNAKAIALMIFVAIPLPLTGAWSGVIAAFVFGLPFWRSVLAIGAGIVIAGIIVLVSIGAFQASIIRL